VSFSANASMLQSWHIVLQITEWLMGVRERKLGFMAVRNTTMALYFKYRIEGKILVGREARDAWDSSSSQ
jgi:hypothetical protein